MSKWQALGPVPRQYEAVIRGARFTGPTPRHIIDAWARALEGMGSRLVPDWEDEVWHALSKSHPKHIKRAPGKPKREGVSVAAAMSFAKFMARRVTDQTLVAPEEARRRAAICTRCPKWAPVLGCSACKEGLKLTIRPPEDVSAPPACAACGCWLPLKVWIPRRQLGSASEFPYDEGCWMRETPSSPGDSPEQTNG